ncbi:MAG: bifunctional methylenetetrahydrofolate dehydrogenase/methenyltetrahydrofolate cyclohydrolase FolD [Alphaproteobacteria bacterium]|nr:MAG: bifunctional methylenetetrahydrofolate dehydrogenase/methenyltetrahydrofolate cyclohydrolase FolD [Alphaproteobacteria bacterium]
MRTAQIIDGKALAAQLRARVAEAVGTLKAEHGITPGLAVVLVGDNPASEVYVRNKERQTRAAGMNSFDHHLPESTTQAELVALVESLNARPEVHGILVQLPLPDGVSADAVIETIDPRKDVDGFHPMNAGRLMIGRPGLVPCTPLGCILLAKQVSETLAGLNAVVVGRSNIVGKPVAQLLLQENCTVTIAHSRTHALPEVTGRADLLVAAVGRPEMIRGDWIKPGAIVIDVGINRIDTDDGKTQLVGDVAFDEALGRAGAITPVPGGVGPMTIACLLRNTLQAACAQHGIAMPAL